VPALRRHAQHLTASNAEDGVALVIERALAGELIAPLA
jgi:hypothetical protein